MKFLKGVLLSLALMAILVGCGENNSQNNNIQNENNNIEQSQDNNENSDINTNTDTNTDIDTNVDSTQIDFSMGEWKSNVYTNEFLDIKFDLPEKWKYETDISLASVMGIDLNNNSEGFFKNNEVLKKIAEAKFVYYLVATDNESSSEVKVISEKAFSEVSVDTYMNQLKGQLEGIKDIKYEVSDITQETIGDNIYQVIEVALPDFGINQKNYVRKQDEYFIDIMITSSSMESVNEIAKRFE